MPLSRDGSPVAVSATLKPRVADNASNEVLRRFQSSRLSVVIPLRVVGVGISSTRTMRSGSGYGSGFRRTASTRLNIAALAPMPMAMTPTAIAEKPRSRQQEEHAVADVAGKSVDPADTSLVPVRFLHRFDTPETAARRPPRFLRRQAGGDAVTLRQLEVRDHFAFELPLEAPGPDQRQQPANDVHHDFASRKRATSAVARSQFATSTRSWRLPAAVSE